jgi:hypothetical protein
VSNDKQQEPQQDDESKRSSEDTAIEGHGPGGVNFKIPVRRDDMRVIVWALAAAIVVLASFFGYSLVK